MNQDSHCHRVLSRHDINRALARIAHEVLERNKGAENVVVMGIVNRGFPLAERLAIKLNEADPAFDVGRVGKLDVTMFRDDLAKNPTRKLAATSVPAVGIDGAVVVLVDDVFCSGRTVRAALDALGSLGHPRLVQLAVLIDRGHRELPIQADYVGKNIPTSRKEIVKVLLRETDDIVEDAVLLCEAGAR